jgi:hypothetical protein
MEEGHSLARIITAVESAVGRQRAIAVQADALAERSSS